jgi:hypothetical protein
LVDRLDRTMAQFFADYREDQAEQRRIYDAIMGRLSDLTQRMGITERDIKDLGGTMNEHSQRIRQLERIGPVPMVDP